MWHCRNAQPHLSGNGISNFAFSISNANNIVLSGFNISYYSNGIIIRNYSTNCLIRDNVLYSNMNTGINIVSDTADRNRLINNEIRGSTNNFCCICIDDGDQNTVMSNHTYQARYGLYVIGSAMENQILYNTVVSNSGVAVYLGGVNVRSNFVFWAATWLMIYECGSVGKSFPTVATPYRLLLGFRSLAVRFCRHSLRVICACRH